MAETKTTSTQSPKKKRSPIERAIVWGLIGVLLAVALWEGWARFGYERTLAKWQEAIAAAESAEKDGSLKLADAEEMIVGFPKRSEGQAEGARKTVTFQWNSLFKRDRQISVTYGGDPPEVLGLETADAPEEEVAEAPPVDEEYIEMDSAPGGGGPPPMHSEARTRGEPEPTVEAPADDAAGDNPSSEGPALGRDTEASSSEPEPEPE